MNIAGPWRSWGNWSAYFILSFRHSSDIMQQTGRVTGEPLGRGLYWRIRNTLDGAKSISHGCRGDPRRYYHRHHSFSSTRKIAPGQWDMQSTLQPFKHFWNVHVLIIFSLCDRPGLRASRRVIKGSRAHERGLQVHRQTHTEKENAFTFIHLFISQMLMLLPTSQGEGNTSAVTSGHYAWPCVILLLYWGSFLKKKPNIFRCTSTGDRPRPPWWQFNEMHFFFFFNWLKNVKD